ncbi:hypothetical protein [Pedobacter gandavensis]|uniref:hypothetical protein n=1 Tax=Pedobacter gandavensis TaxID=2679963 RepID=UPI002931C709|nr:hypothetical protein [Pedobacter gandavensis]
MNEKPRHLLQALNCYKQPLQTTMPTIEIVSINSTALRLNQKSFSIAIIEENKLKSHRGLFYDLLQQQNGIIVHIGNPEFKYDKSGGFFAGELIDWGVDYPGELITIPVNKIGNPIFNNEANQQFRFKFLDQYKPDIDKLLKIALDKSPIKKVCFLTDYQFGPEKETIEIIYTINDFWQQHDNNGLNLNTLYEMYGR